MLFTIGFLILMICFYVNTLFYSISLLAVITALLCYLVSHLILHTLTMLMLLIVYVGAMMILIGYICAICPNLILSSTNSSLSYYVYYFAAFVVFFPERLPVVLSAPFAPMCDYFYATSGGLIFSAIVIMLFITLLIVTSQYMTPKGPFRSVSI